MAGEGADAPTFSDVVEVWASAPVEVDDLEEVDARRLGALLTKIETGGDVLVVGSGSLSGALAGAIDDAGVSRRTWRAPFDPEDALLVDHPDDSFDVVVLPEGTPSVHATSFLRMLSEVRRVGRGQLVYCQPHGFVDDEHLAVSEDVLSASFPAAERTLLAAPEVPWLMIEERLAGPVRRGASPELARIEELEAQVKDLRSRRSFRAATWAYWRVQQLKQLRERLQAGR